MEQETELGNYTIMQDHRHKTSSVWKYFGDLNMNGEIVDSKHVYCTKCFEESRMKKYQKSTSTGNLIKHLKRAHNVAEQPSYRVKHEKDRMVVTKEESIHGDDEDSEYYVDGVPSFIPINQATSESDNNEYLVHDINELLILEISKRPQIYDPSLCAKNKAQVRRQLWLEIYDSLNHLIEFEKLPKIWKNIRDRYQKIKKDQERDGRALNATGKPRYRYYNQLQFLDDVDCNETMVEEDNKMSLPIENFVSNFIYMEDEPQVEQPDHRELILREEPQLLEQHHLETDELHDEDDEEEEEDDEDEEELQDENDDDVECNNTLENVTMHDLDVVVKDDMFDTGETPQNKKIKLDPSLITSDDDPDPMSQHPASAHHLQSSHHRVRDLMTPDNIASLLVEQHQHEILCHQHSDLSVASSSSPSSSPQIPVATWRIASHLTDSIGVANNSALQSHHIQQLPTVVPMSIVQSLPSVSTTTATNHSEPNLSPTNQQQSQHLSTTNPPHQQDTQKVTTTTTTDNVNQQSKSKGGGSSEEFVIFGSYVAEVMRNMDKQKARMLQMKVMQLIAEYDGGAQ